MTPEQEVFLDKASMLLLLASNVTNEASAILDGDVELKSIADILVSAHLYMAEKIRTSTTPLASATDQGNEFGKRLGYLIADCRQAADLLASRAG